MSKVKKVHIVAQSNLDKVAQDSKKLGKELDEVGKKGKTGMSKLKGGVNKAVTGFKALRGAIAATGIGLLLTTIVTLTQKFKASAPVQKKFTELMTKIGVYTQPVVKILNDLIVNVLDRIVNFSFADFWNQLKTYVVEKVEGVIELFGALGTTMKHVFTGEWSKISEDAAKVADIFTNKVSIIGDVTRAVGKVAKDTFKQYKEGLEEAKNASDGLIESQVNYRELRRQANEVERENRAELEKLRGVVEDENRSAKDRLDALTEMKRLNDEINVSRVAALNAEMKMLEFKKAQGTATEEELDNLSELRGELFQLSEDYATINNEINRERRAILNPEADAAEVEATDEGEDKANKEKLTAKEISDYKKQLMRDEAQMKEDIFNRTTQLMGAESKLAKVMHFLKMGMKLKEVLFEGKKGVTDAVKDGTEVGVEATKANLKALGTLNPAVVTATKIATAAGLVASMASIAKKKSASKKLAALGGGSAPSGAGGGSPLTSTASAPNFNVIGKTDLGTNLLREDIQSINEKPVKAYVVESEMTDVQKGVEEARRLGRL